MLTVVLAYLILNTDTIDVFQQQQSSHQTYSSAAQPLQPQPQPQPLQQPQQQQYIKPWTSGSSSSYLDQQPYMTNALFYSPNPASNAAVAAGDSMYLPRMPNVPQHPFPGAYPQMVAASSMYQPYYQPFYPTHRTSVSIPAIPV